MSLKNRAKCNGRPPAPAYQPVGDERPKGTPHGGSEVGGNAEISMSEKEEKLLEQIRDGLNYQYIVWFDGENFQIGCTKQELYQWLHCVRMWLNKARQERIDNEVSLQTVKKEVR